MDPKILVFDLDEVETDAVGDFLYKIIDDFNYLDADQSKKEGRRLNTYLVIWERPDERFPYTGKGFEVRATWKSRVQPEHLPYAEGVLLYVHCTNRTKSKLRVAVRCEPKSGMSLLDAIMVRVADYWGDVLTPVELVDLGGDMLSEPTKVFDPKQQVSPNDSQEPEAAGDSQAAIETIGTRLQKKRPGRPPIKEYDAAAERIRDGQDYNESFDQYVEEAGIVNIDQRVYDSFHKAMGRRGITQAAEKT